MCDTQGMFVCVCVCVKLCCGFCTWCAMQNFTLWASNIQRVLHSFLMERQGTMPVSSCPSFTYMHFTHVSVFGTQRVKVFVLLVGSENYCGKRVVLDDAIAAARIPNTWFTLMSCESSWMMCSFSAFTVCCSLNCSMCVWQTWTALFAVLLTQFSLLLTQEHLCTLHDIRRKFKTKFQFKIEKKKIYIRRWISIISVITFSIPLLTDI